jgi:hypothetical protein
MTFTDHFMKFAGSVNSLPEPHMASYFNEFGAMLPYRPECGESSIYTESTSPSHGQYPPTIASTWQSTGSNAPSEVERTPDLIGRLNLHSKIRINPLQTPVPDTNSFSMASSSTPLLPSIRSSPPANAVGYGSLIYGSASPANAAVSPTLFRSSTTLNSFDGAQRNSSSPYNSLASPFTPETSFSKSSSSNDPPKLRLPSFTFPNPKPARAADHPRRPTTPPTKLEPSAIIWGTKGKHAQMKDKN